MSLLGVPTGIIIRRVCIRLQVDRLRTLLEKQPADVVIIVEIWLDVII